MGEYLAEEFSQHDKDLVTLLADSLLPAEWLEGALATEFGDPVILRKLKELPLPSLSWLESCIEELASSARLTPELVEAMKLLGTDSTPNILYQDAYVFAHAVIDRDFADWAVQALADPIENHIVDDWDDFEAQDRVSQLLDHWSNDITFKHLRKRFLDLAKSEVRNAVGQTAEQVLVAAGLLE